MQGQLALTGLEWCDFVIWTLGGISVERIYFDVDHCENLRKIHLPNTVVLSGYVSLQE